MAFPPENDVSHWTLKDYLLHKSYLILPQNNAYLICLGYLGQVVDNEDVFFIGYYSLDERFFIFREVINFEVINPFEVCEVINFKKNKLVIVPIPAVGAFKKYLKTWDENDLKQNGIDPNLFVLDISDIKTGLDYDNFSETKKLEYLKKISKIQFS